MAKLFGTDGIRGVANTYPMTPEVALQVGRALIQFFKRENSVPKIVIGQDTRVSGQMLTSALSAGISAEGGDALLCGVIPTPGVAYHTLASGADAGVVISASHNPYHDNGIKVFGPDGFKLSDEIENKLENLILDYVGGFKKPGIGPVGRMETYGKKAKQAYVNFLIDALPEGFSLSGMKIVLDCANGATYQAAPEIFKRLGTEVTALFIDPDGKNINDECGSEHPAVLAETVRSVKADIGLAFDGDGDRLIAVDETGRVLSGDQILAVCVGFFSKKSKLKNHRVVTTVMSNLGFTAAMKGLGIEHLVADVGDRYVLQKMRDTDAVLGGEDSGHMIFLDHHTTGDGLLAALKLCEVISTEKVPLSSLSKVMTVFPQVLMNVEVRSRPVIDTVPEIKMVIESVLSELKDEGRVLVRYSGTQPLCRVMVEGPTLEQTHHCCERISTAVKKAIGV